MMNVRMMIAAGALLASPAALAQEAPAEQTSEDLICQLAGSCGEAVDTGEAEDATDEAAQPSPVPGARISATRGFKIANKVNAPAASEAKPTARRPTAAAKPAQVTTAVPRRPAAPGKSVASAAAVMNAGSGRADLRVSFVTGSAELTEYGQREAQKFAEALKSPALEGMRFRIEGHTDAVGNRDYNLDLSRRRAQSVVDYLAGKGADRTRFDVAGYGFDKPLPGTSPTAAANRRVEVLRIK